MIRSVNVAEEIVIRAKNKVGLLADISAVLVEKGINIESVVGYQELNTAVLMLITNANLTIVNELKKKYKFVKEIEVVIAELENRPGALETVTSALKKDGIDIRHLYLTSPYSGGPSRMIFETSDNEAAIAVLTKLTSKGSA